MKMNPLGYDIWKEMNPLDYDIWEEMKMNPIQLQHLGEDEDKSSRL